ncbi:hypothetical protein [Eubacterium sp.]|uniref:hypothetical protein n=1 Tax=Eubacterium sp. TaxID=142586 RepID=UPI0035206CBF
MQASLIEDEDLRAQIKGSGIGTSATRAEIIKKLANIKYICIKQEDTGNNTDSVGRNDIWRSSRLN